MSNEIFNQMLSAYEQTTEQQKRNAIFEVNQQVILAGLYHGGFFDLAAFYGGTCLRIFHGLQRFSEDMDFSLLAPNEDFDFTNYFQPIIDEFAIIGREVEIKKKDKKNFGKVESAFLKDNTDVYDVTFQTEKSIKIKIEVDTQPPLKFNTEQKLLMLPESFMARCFTLPDQFAGKMHALVYRAWKNRVKGRDWYDFEWYIRHQIPLDFTHLAERALQFNGEDITKNSFFEKLKERLSSADINQVKADVLPFVRNTRELDIWSNDYFLTLADMIKFEEDCIE
ncbi:MAG: nucleotidyl transferase AbiEii/AbiGii toxin family protein [Prevotella sp.]|nr:nucleotidyl transferase AbiEii/AbiGii toxin family protein [Prevotella sp.]